MKELLEHIRTPPLQDKRWLTVLFVLASIFLLVAFKRDIPDGVLTLVGELVTAFVGISQWGQRDGLKTVAKAAGIEVVDAAKPPATP